MSTTTISTAAPSVRGQDETPSGYPPRYQVIGEPNGFRVEGRDRCPAFVRLSPGKTILLITSDAGTLDLYDEEAGYFHSGIGYICGLYGYYRLLETLAAFVMHDWKRPDHTPNEWSGVYQWAIGRTKRALHFRGVYSEWRRLLALVPDPQRSLSRAVFAATFDASRPGCETWPEILSHPYLVQDILRYRAAASACHYAERLVRALGDSLLRSRERGARRPQGIGERCIAYRERDQQSRELAWEQPDDYDREQRALRTEALAILSQDWKGLYASQGKAGRSLCRTLMNLPGGISGSMLLQLPHSGAPAHRTDHRPPGTADAPAVREDRLPTPPCFPITGREPSSRRLVARRSSRRCAASRPTFNILCGPPARESRNWSGS